MYLDGKKISNEILEKIKLEINQYKDKPKVVDIVIGNLSINKLYIKSKQKACEKVGILFELKQFDESIKKEEIIEFIQEKNQDATVDAIMIQLPIPDTYHPVINTIAPIKDVDGLTYQSQVNLYNNEPTMLPCTPKGILRILEYYQIPVQDKNVVIIGRSNLIGKPLLHLLLNKNANITVCHSKTSNLSKYTLKADILICATNIPNLIQKDMVKESCIVIDTGISYQDGILEGNVEKNTYDYVKAITPVPGGVGPMTVAMFIENIMECYHKNRK